MAVLKVHPSATRGPYSSHASPFALKFGGPRQSLRTKGRQRNASRQCGLAGDQILSGAPGPHAKRGYLWIGWPPKEHPHLTLPVAELLLVWQRAERGRDPPECAA